MIKIHVFLIKRGYDGDRGRQTQKRAVTFIRLRYQELTLSHLCVATDVFQPSADDYGRVQLSSSQNRCYQGGGCGFAMSPGDGDAVFHSHQLCQHFRSRNDGNHTLPGRNHFHIVRFDCAGGYNQLRVLDVFRRMFKVNPCTELFEVVGDGGTYFVRSTHFVALVDKDFSDPAHARASNPNEMDSFGFS